MECARARVYRRTLRNYSYAYLELGSLNRANSLGVERTLFSVESAGLYFWRMRTSFIVECLLRVLNRRVAVAKDASPWQKQALNKLDASSMETTRIREPQGPFGSLMRVVSWTRRLTNYVKPGKCAF